MSSKDIPLTRQDGAGAELSSVWSCTNSDAAPIRGILVSPQGVLGVASDTTMHLYAGAPSFGDARKVSMSPARLTAHCFSADGTYMLTGDSEGFVKWWEVHSGEEHTSTQFPFNKDTAEELHAISSIVCASDTHLIAVTCGNSLCVYGDDGRRLHSIGPLDSTIRSVAWKKPDELAVNVGSGTCMIHVTAEEYDLRQRYPDETNGGLKTLACSSKGNMFAAGGITGIVQIWDLASESNEEISVLVKGLPNAPAHDTPVQCLEWDSSSRFLVAAGGSDIIVWDMHDTSEKEEGKDNGIVCFGHGQKAKITTLSFQPKGQLLATAGNDCQVLIFDSSQFTSSGVIGRVVGCLVSGKISHGDPDTAITALAWHPSGLILAGTTNGRVDAFEVPGAVQETPRVSNGIAADIPFLIKRTNTTGRRPSTDRPSGWAGEPLNPSRMDDGLGGKGFVRRPKAAVSGTMGGIQRPIGRPKVYMGNFKQPARQYPENAGNVSAPDWSPTVPPQQMHWQGHPPQQMQPPYPSPAATSAAAARYAEPPANPPHTPESNSSEGAHRGPPPNVPPPVGSERPPNTNGVMEQGHHPMMNGAPMQYPGCYMPFPSPVPMGFMTSPYYYPYQAPPQMHPEAMQAAIPSYPPQRFIRSPPSHPSKAPICQTGGGRKVDMPKKDGSPDLEEDLRSKSSEAANNGVNNNAPPTPHAEVPNPYHPGHAHQGQTLYVGNLAPGVEESLLHHFFAPYGFIMGVQVIRDRETQISRGFGFVTFMYPASARAAMEHLDSAHLQGPFEGRKLKVSFSNRR